MLIASRNGDVDAIRNLIASLKADEIELDVNCIGKKKFNKDWCPLHLASYFGHRDVVQLLLENGADVNVINDVGDSPLHRAAYTGRQDIVTLLLQHNADVNILNAESQSPKQVARTADIKSLIEAAELTEARRNEERFRKAARDGDLNTLTDLLKSNNHLNVNCVDAFGNTALHLAATRGRKEVVVLLLQNGVDTSMRNSKGQMALDAAVDPRLRLLLNVRSIGHVEKSTIHRHEGTLYRKVRLLGWKSVWVLLERGVLSMFSTRGDASAGTNRKLYRYLDGAQVQQKSGVMHVFSLKFSDRSVMWFSVGPGSNVELIRVKWENALKEHIRYSDNLVKLDGRDSDDDKVDDIVLPLGSLQDTLQTARAHHQIIECQVTQMSTDLQSMTQSDNHASGSSEQVAILGIHQQMQQLVDSSKEMLTALSHCLSIFTQQEQVKEFELETEREKSRVLQESLHVLAQEHFALEQSLVEYRSPTSFSASEVDEYYDCEDAAVSDCNDDEIFENSVSKASNVADIFTEMSNPNTPDSSVKLPPVDQDLGKSIWGARCRLPAVAFPRTFSVWNFLKQCIGKELSKITMPIVLNEPLSFLQRTVEYLEYADLIRRASDCDDPVQRLEFVSAFAVSASASNWDRLGKPFNPLLGETYELNREDLGYKVVCEQVSHHPPISALHAVSSNFTFSGAIQPKLKFWGKSVEVKPVGTVTLHLTRHNEVYTWQNVNCCVHNIIVGTIWIEHYGNMDIINHATGFCSKLQFKQKEWFSADVHKVEGFIYDNRGNKVRALYGKWTEALYSCSVADWQKYQQNSTAANSKAVQVHNAVNCTDDNTASVPPVLVSQSVEPQRDPCGYRLSGQQLLWMAIARTPESSRYYNFTLFAMLLNELDDETKSHLPPTDCRLRPDIRKMENGDIDGAAEEKNRLEEKQRAARKLRNGDQFWKPKWFEQRLNQYTNKEDWAFTGEFWNRDWSRCPDIF